MSQLPSGTVTFLFTDIEGSTRLWEEHPDAMGSSLARHDEILHTAIESQGGTVFSTAGDAFSAAFNRAEDALGAAVAAQLALTGEDWGGVDLRVRMSVHTGEAEERDGDYFGPSLNRAARILQVGHGGQILVTETAREFVGDSGFRFADLGVHRLRDLSRPEHIYQLSEQDLPGRFPALNSLDPSTNNLPVQLTSFVGREEEIVELVKLVSGSRLITLTGVGGVGKTRLALQTAVEVLPDFEDGVWLVELAQLTDPKLIPSTVMNVLGIDEKATEDPVDTTVKWLSKRSLLLVLDNCEHLLDPAARLVARILKTATGVSVLATSRERLGVPGEYAFPVRSLASPESVDESLRPALLRYPAMRLFAERGEAAKPGWRITADDAAVVAGICRRLDGIPLAIELAAARLSLMNTTEIAEQLDDVFRLLTGGARTVLPRQQTLEAAVDWSYDLLTEEEKILFTRLAVFMGGFTLDAAQAVCGVDPIDETRVLDLLGHLVDKSLVQTRDHQEMTRYQMLETIRVYARRRFVDSDEAESLRRDHARYFLDLAEQALRHLLSEEEDDYWLRRLEDDLDNLRQTMGWALEATQSRIVQALAGSLFLFFGRTSRRQEGLEWAQRAIAVSDEPTQERAKALVAVGTWQGETESLDQAIEISRAVGDDETLRRALNNRAVWAGRRGRWDEAERIFLEFMKLAHESGDKAGVALALHNLSGPALARADYPLAIERAQQAVETALDAGLTLTLYAARLGLLKAYRTAGKRKEAESVLADVNDMELGSFKPDYHLFWGSLLATDRGELNEALSLLRQAVTVLRLGEARGQIAVTDEVLSLGARLLGHSEHFEASAVVLGAADAFTRAEGYVRPSWEAVEVEAVVSRVREALGEDMFQITYDQGRRLDRKEALDYLAAALDELT